MAIPPRSPRHIGRGAPLLTKTPEAQYVSWFIKVLTSSIGKKVLVALSGLGLVGFLVGHLYGNLNLYLGAGALDEYAHHLHELPGFTFIELGLLGMFVLHIPLVIWLSMSNSKARGPRYAVKASKRDEGKGQSLASRMMKVSGVLLLLFLIVHILDFRLERSEFHAADGGVDGLGLEVIATLQNPLIAALYVVGSLLAAWHMFHGIQSAVRSLGFQNDKYTPLIEKAGAALAIVLGLGFASLPIAIQAGVINADDTSAEMDHDHDDEHAHGDEHAH